MKLKIKVTKEILKASMMCGTKPNDKEWLNCAIALAVRDIFPTAEVYGSSIEYNEDDTLISELPKIAERFIIRFDSLKDTPKERLKMTPIEFEVNIPDEVIDEIGIDQAIEIINNSKTLEYADL